MPWVCNMPCISSGCVWEGGGEEESNVHRYTRIAHVAATCGSGLISSVHVGVVLYHHVHVGVALYHLHCSE